MFHFNEQNKFLGAKMLKSSANVWKLFKKCFILMHKISFFRKKCWLFWGLCGLLWGLFKGYMDYFGGFGGLFKGYVDYFGEFSEDLSSDPHNNPPNHLNNPPNLPK